VLPPGAGPSVICASYLSRSFEQRESEKDRLAARDSLSGEGPRVNQSRYH